LRRSIRIFWLISLLVFFSGCSGFRHYQFPHESSSQENSDTGTMVRVTAKEGDINEGILREIEPGFVVIQAPEAGGAIHNYPEQDVLKLEIFKEATSLEELGVATLVVGLFVGGYYLAQDRPHFSPDGIE
jgi:hypothetical protein